MKKTTAWISIALTGSLVTAGAVVAATHNSDNHGIVTRVIDGDTVDMTIAGNETRVRLLNIDTPETVDPNKAVECLGPEASEHLESLLQPGTKSTWSTTSNEKIATAAHWPPSTRTMSSSTGPSPLLA
ncbi:thermonuclease family protein [Glutamicibacter sp. NPDC055491]